MKLWFDVNFHHILIFYYLFIYCFKNLKDRMVVIEDVLLLKAIYLLSYRMLKLILLKNLS